MKSYLSLIPISAKVHRRQNRMTLLCIIFAVFLVTAVFSMADMGVRMEQARLLDKHGSEALAGMSGTATMQTLYATAAVLFVLILIAGVLMISSSINSNVAQRTKFFGMMRCIGMSKQQIIRFVRLEALHWCKTAVPIGVALGILVTWVLCAALRFFVGGEFAALALFGISPIGMLSGVVVGVIAVLLAAGSPAKRAARVSPVTAVLGHADSANKPIPMKNSRLLKVETLLGIQHAVSAKKNLALMTGSFALSIILFLSFSVFIELIGYLMPQSSNLSDINIMDANGANTIGGALAETVRGMPGVKRVFSSSSSLGMSAQANGQPVTVDMISYDAFELDCLAKDKLLQRGHDLEKVYGDSGFVLAVWDANRPLAVGDTLQIGTEQLTIAGLLQYNPFSSDGSADENITVLTSAETFARLTGITDYSLVLVQTTKEATDDDVAAIANAVGETAVFQDRREQRTTATYMAFQLFVYGFLAIITLVTVLNIMNSISMSVSARTKQYGAMRAVGMDEQQMTKMIAAEALTYALSGCVVGCAAGLLLSRLLFDALVASHFSYAVWKFPTVPLLVILLLVLAAALASVYAPAQRIRHLSVTETLNEL